MNPSSSDSSSDDESSRLQLISATRLNGTVIGIHAKAGHGAHWFTARAMEAIGKKKVETFSLTAAAAVAASILLDKPAECFHDKTLKNERVEIERDVTPALFKTRVRSALLFITGLDADIFSKARGQYFIERYCATADELVDDFVEYLDPLLSHSAAENTLTPKCKTHDDFCQGLYADVVRKQFDMNAWTRIVESAIKKSSAEVKFVTDIRYSNDAEMVGRFNGITIRVEAPSVNQNLGETNLDAVQLHTFTNDRSFEQDSIPALLFDPDVYCVSEATFRTCNTPDHQIICVRHGFVFFCASLPIGGYAQSVRSRVSKVLQKRVSKSCASPE